MEWGVALGLSAGAIGALIGALLAVVNYLVTRVIVQRLERAPDAANGKWTIRVLRLVALADFVILPAAGYLIAPLVL